jgi:hypothetical protein
MSGEVVLSMLQADPPQPPPDVLRRVSVIDSGPRSTPGATKRQNLQLRQEVSRLQRRLRQRAQD